MAEGKSQAVIMYTKVISQQFKEIVDSSCIVKDEEMAEDFRLFLCDYGIEVRKRNPALFVFDYIFYTRDLRVASFSINLKNGGKTAIEMVKQVLNL